MANSGLNILIDIRTRGREAVQGVEQDLQRLERTSGGATSGMRNLAGGMAGAAAALAGVAVAAKAAWGVLEKGAALDLTARRFDSLAASIGNTSDVLLGDMRAATSGMVSDMELMASASQIIGLKLADTSDQVVRLSAVSGQLGWDMQQVILTFAGMSTMRLDALGLSVEDVTSRAKELEAAGMSAQEAFKEAVIQAGEARLGTLGSEAETASGAMKQLSGSLATLRDSLLMSVTATLEQAGAFKAMSNAASGLSAFTQFTTYLDELRASGEITTEQWNALNATIRRGGVDAAQASLEQMQLANRVEMLSEAVDVNQDAWEQWGAYISMRNQLTGDELLELEFLVNGVTAGIVQAASVADRALGNAQHVWASRNNTRGTPQQRTNRYANWVDSTNERNRANEATRRELLESEQSFYSYGGAVGYAITQEDALAAAHARLGDAFTAEITAKPEDGLINAEGMVNVQAMNEALYQQAQAAGASATELAMLGIATGKFTREQAAAALKAAVLQETIRKVAEGVASGNVKYDAAVGYLEEFRQKLDASGGGAEDATANVEDLIGMAQELTQGPYAADINANTTQARADLQAVLDLINGISGVHQATVVVDTEAETPQPRARGGPVLGGSPYLVGEAGPELFVPNGGGYVVPTHALNSFQSGGSTMITVNNFVDGRTVARQQLDDITEDRLLHALRAAGVA